MRASVILASYMQKAHNLKEILLPRRRLMTVVCNHLCFLSVNRRAVLNKCACPKQRMEAEMFRTDCSPII